MTYSNIGASRHSPELVPPPQQDRKPAAEQHVLSGANQASDARETASTPASKPKATHTVLASRGVALDNESRDVANQVASQFREKIEDIKSHIALFEEKGTRADDGTLSFHARTDRFISINRAAPHGNKRPLRDLVALMNEFRGKNQPETYLVRDAHELFSYVETLQKSMSRMPSAMKQTVRFIVKPDESTYDHSLMLEVDVSHDAVIMAGIDPAVPTLGYFNHQILEDAAKQFPSIKGLEMGIGLTGIQQRMGCFQFALAAAEMIPSTSLEDLKETIAERSASAKKGEEESLTPCVLIDDKKDQLLPPKVYLFGQSPDAIKHVLEHLEATGQAGKLQEQLKKNLQDHEVKYIDRKTGDETVFINSIASFVYGKLKQLLAHLESMEGDLQAQKDFLRKTEKVLIHYGDDTWRSPLSDALAGLAWTPKDEHVELAAQLGELARSTHGGNTEEARQFIFERTKVFLDAIPELASQPPRLRRMPLRLVEEFLKEKTHTSAEKVQLIERVQDIFIRNREKISKADYVFLRDSLTDWRAHAEANGELNQALANASTNMFHPEDYLEELGSRG